MTEPTATDQPMTNPDRPPLYKVYAGRVLKGKTVTIVSTDDELPVKAKALVEEQGVATPKQAVVRYTHLERIYRTNEERELGRDFTAEELAANERQWQTRWTAMTEERARKSILEGIERIAVRLDRAAAELRQTLAYEAIDPAEKAIRVQHELAWLFPNLGSDGLTREAIDWTMASRDLQRLLTEGIEPA